MLQVLFQIGSDRYALDSRQVVEIVPRVRFKEVPGAPDYVRGLFEYRGRIVPVIDLCRLVGKPAAPDLMSSRIMLVNYPDRRGGAQVLGLLAENVTDTVRPSPGASQPAAVAAPAAEFLGPVAATDAGLVQEVRVADLLPPDAQALLFPAGENGA